MEELISVIIPVYNVESYIRECVSSVIGQTYNNIEIILVDDGSTDASGSICDECKTMDSRIKVIHKENGGLSDARNAGIQIAKGKYVSFIDSDDYVSPFFIEIMYTVLKNGHCDIVALNGGVDFWDHEESRPKLAVDSSDYIVSNCSSHEVLEKMLYQSIATGAPFKLYSRDIFESVKFPKGYLYEDCATTYKAFLKTEHAAIITSRLYAYRKRRDSIIRQSFSEKKLCAINIYEQLTNDPGLISSGLRKAAVSRAFAMLYSVFLQVPAGDTYHKKMIWNTLKQGRLTVVLDPNKNMRKKNKYGAIVSLFGMNISYYLGRKFGQKGTM